MTFTMKLKTRTFKAGELVPTSGVYAVLHSNPHAIGTREMYFEGSRFPECGGCSDGVVYRLESLCATKLAPVFPELAFAA
jgi:hypothetical protein